MGHFPKMGIVAVTIGEVRSIKSCLFFSLSHTFTNLLQLCITDYSIRVILLFQPWDFLNHIHDIVYIEMYNCIRDAIL